MSKDLKSLIKTQVTISMKDGDKFRTTVLRMILAEIQKIEIEEKSDLDELQITSILEKMIKQRNDAISQFEQAKRQELADKEKQEIEIIKEFLPEQMSDDEVSELVSKIISEVGAQDMKDMGKVMGSLKPLIAGKADAGVVSQLVKKALSSYQIDEKGLDSLDRQYLSFLNQNNNIPTGLDSIASGLGDDSSMLEFVVEPYLIKIGFLTRTPRGRLLTATGKKYIDSKDDNF